MPDNPSSRAAMTSPARPARVQPSLPPGLVLLIAVAAMSWAGPLVRFSTAPALVIAAWRLIFSVAFIAALAAASPGALAGIARLRRSDKALALAAGPMMLGHTGVNYALRYLRAYVANLALLGEPIGATLIAWLLPAIGEAPSAQTVVGGGLIVSGIALGMARDPPSNVASVHGQPRRSDVD